MHHLGPRLNRLNRILISISCNFFPEAHLQRTLKLSVLGLEKFRDGWPTEKSFPDTHE